MNEQAVRPPIISAEYLAQQRELHRNPHYGVASFHFAATVADIMRKLNIRSVTDYGAGKCNLRLALNKLGLVFDYFPFDPAFPEYGPPKPAELMCCIDVLEHIEPEFLDAVLGDLQRITLRVGFLAVATVPAEKNLPDGRNAHLIIQPWAWWQAKLSDYFALKTKVPSPGGFCLLVEPKINQAQPPATRQ
jgi:hypothetical protein